MSTTTILGEVALERARQIADEGFGPKHDDAENSQGQLARAAACYALGKAKVTNLGEQTINIWPWEENWWKPADQRRNLVKAAALIIAEIERLDRA